MSATFDPIDHVKIMTRVELLRLLEILPPMHTLRPYVVKALKKLGGQHKRKKAA